MKRINIKLKYYIIWISILFLTGVQVRTFGFNYQASPKDVFEKIQKGIETSNVSAFSEYLSSQVYLSLNTGEKGYYSRNQMYNLLQGYLSLFKPISFKVSSRLLNTSNPYFSGKFHYISKGKYGTVQVYISLTLIENNWEITQITFN